MCRPKRLLQQFSWFAFIFALQAWRGSVKATSLWAYVETAIAFYVMLIYKSNLRDDLPKKTDLVAILGFGFKTGQLGGWNS